MDLVDRVLAVREAGAVERSHNIPHLRSYDDARHSYGVACLCRLFWPKDMMLVVAALFHDTPERWTGDIPSQVLDRHPSLRRALAEEDKHISSALGLPSEHELGAGQWQRLRAADRLDFWLWTFDEESLGNRNVLQARSRIEQYMVSADTPEEVLKFMTDYNLRAKDGPLRLPEVFPW